MLRRNLGITKFLGAVAVVLGSSICGTAHAQTGQATLRGQVVDPQHLALPDAQVTVINTAKGISRVVTTDKAGGFVVGLLPPDTYAVRVEHSGFAVGEVPVMALHTAQDVSVELMLKVGAANETVNVTTPLTNESPALSLTVNRDFVENAPLNGRSFQDLVNLAPGVVDTQGGSFSINGQRPDANYFTVDGVSANLGGLENTGAAGFVGPALAGQVSMQTALGTTQSMVPVDGLQEFTIQTAGSTADYGRNPGGQVQFTTRSGTNQFHGSAFEYFRNEALDANTWLNNSLDLPRAAERQNDFGATLGGPLLRLGADMRTFFFASYEGLRLKQPAPVSPFPLHTPTAALRAYAAPSVQPYLNAVPLPNGPTDPLSQCTVPGTSQPCTGLYQTSFSQPSNLDTGNARIDADLGSKMHAFVRFSDTPSYALTGYEQDDQYSAVINTRTLTAGLTTTFTSHLVDDFRFNFSLDHEENVGIQQSVNGSVPFDASLMIPSQYEGPGASLDYQISARGTNLNFTHTLGGESSAQHQYQLVDSVTWSKGAHSIKFGGDWRRLTPTYSNQTYASYLEIEGFASTAAAAAAISLSDIHNGIASTVGVSAGIPGKPVFNNLSLYVQDHWNATPRFSLDYGIRWEFNPPPGPSNGTYPAAISSIDPNTAVLLPTGTQPYKTYYDHFAPRLGFSYRPFENQTLPTVIRAAFGIYFDTAQQAIGYAYADTPPFYVSGNYPSNVPMPLTAAALAPPPLNQPVDPAVDELFGLTVPNLTSPYTESWNLAVDQALNKANTLTIAYVGNAGKKLLFTDFYYGTNLEYAGITNNAANSSYHSLQLQDVGRLANGLFLVASATWAHAIDNASTDFSQQYPIKGNSNYDIRRLLKIALNYQTSAHGEQRFVRAVSGGWTFANVFQAQSGSPVTVTQEEDSLPNGETRYYSPMLVPGVPIYLHGKDTSGCTSNALKSTTSPAGVPGGWCLNPAAFAQAQYDSNGYPITAGAVGRNYLRTPPFWAWNTSLARTFPIFESLKMDFRVDAFNILNRANLNDVDGNFFSPTFGQLVNGQVTHLGAPNALYETGGPRSLQLSLKLKF